MILSEPVGSLSESSSSNIGADGLWLKDFAGLTGRVCLPVAGIEQVTEAEVMMDGLSSLSLESLDPEAMVKVKLGFWR